MSRQNGATKDGLTYAELDLKERIFQRLTYPEQNEASQYSTVRTVKNNAEYTSVEHILYRPKKKFNITRQDTISEAAPPEPPPRLNSESVHQAIPKPKEQISTDVDKTSKCTANANLLEKFPPKSTPIHGKRTQAEPLLKSAPKPPPLRKENISQEKLTTVQNKAIGYDRSKHQKGDNYKREIKEKKITKTKQNVRQIKQLDVSDLIHQSSRSGGERGAGKSPEKDSKKYEPEVILPGISKGRLNLLLASMKYRISISMVVVVVLVVASSSYLTWNVKTPQQTDADKQNSNDNNQVQIIISKDTNGLKGLEQNKVHKHHSNMTYKPKSRSQNFQIHGTNKKEKIENINVCRSNPCRHGRCVDEVTKYTCRCNLGYEGINCNKEDQNHIAMLKVVNKCTFMWNSYCYKVSKSPKPHSKSVTWCREKHQKEMLKFDSYEEFTYVRQYLRDNHHDSDVWVAAPDHAHKAWGHWEGGGPCYQLMASATHKVDDLPHCTNGRILAINKLKKVAICKKRLS